MSTSIKADNIDLTGQVAIGTGGGRGIGCAITKTLAKAGADVAGTARSRISIGMHDRLFLLSRKGESV